jgi:serine/threonine protein kinase
MAEALDLNDSAQRGEPLIGATIAGKYRVAAKLGAGGMGAVYRATRLLIGDEVAVKILHSGHSDPNAAQRFRREAQAAARLKHPNAVNIYDFGITEDGLQYLVMELLDGKSLRRIIKEQGYLAPTVCVELITQTCAALDEAHRQNIIHRDVKPDNIIVNVTGGGPRVKVLDFGIAKLRDDSVRNLTQTGGIIGTPHYMSPEQCLGEELDGRSDIYSMGVVLYEMLCGVVPFRAPISTAVVIQHVNQAPQSPRAINTRISPAVERVVLRALAKNREARPQTAGALAQEFSAAVNSGAFGQTHEGMYSDFEPQSPSSPAGRTESQQRPTVSLDQFSAGQLTRPRRKNALVLLSCAVLGVLIVGSVLGLWLRQYMRQTKAGPEKLAASVATDPNKLPAAFAKKFTGTINNDIKIEMNLQRDGGKLSGTYVYQPVDNNAWDLNSYSDKRVWANKDNNLILLDIALAGTIDDQQHYVLDEIDRNGRHIGVFRGEFISPTQMTGDWSTSSGKESTRFSLAEARSDTNASDYRIVTRQLKKKKTNLNVDLEYPQMEGLRQTDIQDTFNRHMQNSASAALKSAGEASAQSTDATVYEESSRFVVKYRSPRFISLLLSSASEFGGAHGMYGTSSFNYDLQSGSEVKLNSLFRPDANYLGVLSRLCTGEVNRQKTKNGMTEMTSESDVLKTIRENETFCVTQSGLIIIFGVYQLGSFAEGEYRVRIPYSAVREMVDSKSVIAPLVSR